MREMRWIERRSLVSVNLLLVGLAFLLATATPPQALAGKPSAPPRQFELTYCWGTDNPADIGSWCSIAALTLYSNGTFDVYDHGTYYPNAGTWRMRTRRGVTTLTLNAGDVMYEGTRQPDDSYLGAMLVVDGPNAGLSGVWAGNFVP